MTRQRTENERGRHAASPFLLELVAAVTIIGTMVLAAGAVAATAAAIDRIVSLPWYVWALASPVLYLAWLVVYLSLSAFTCGAVGRRNPKPRYAVVDPDVRRDAKETRGLATASMCYRRLALLQSIPLVSFLSWFRRFDRLVLRSYAPSVHIGRGLVNFGGLYDPELTEIGDSVVLGGRSAVAAHSMTMRPDGAMVYVSAPVRIGDRVTIGGESRVALGCVIGADAVVEAGAFVEPYTRISPGEVWGGNPARFRRRRDDIELPPGTTAPLPPAAAGYGSRAEAGLEGARRLVARALGLTPDQASGELGMETCPAWDSLGQLAIAAALLDHHGVALDGPDIFQIRTLAEVAAAAAGNGGARAGQEREEDDTGVSLPDDIELLPLLDAQSATRVLAATPRAPVETDVPLRLQVVASFTAQGLEPTLRLWGRAFGFDVDCRFAGYDQIVQTLLSGVGEPGEVTVVLSRPEDFPSDAADAARALDDAVAAIEHAAATRAPGARLVVGTLPPVVSSFCGLDADDVEALRYGWRSRVAACDGVELFDFAHVVGRLGAAQARSSSLEVLTRGGYSQQLLQELAIALVRQLRAARGRRAKVVAVDCDNTLWGGVVGEIGIGGVDLGPEGRGRSFQLFQRHLKRLRERGLLLVVVSRNEEADVRAMFAEHTAMVLKADDIAAWRVNWEHKSDNLRELAEELNLGLDSFVFLDDDPAVRMEVKTRTPDVHVVPLSPDPAGYCELLDRLWLFDGAPATAEDATRTQKAQEEQQRRDERGTAGSLDDFLARLGLEVGLDVAGDRDGPRVAQLTQRTNQFNLSLRRRTLEEVQALGPEQTVLVLEARDRFGDYGQVGVCVLQPGPDPGSCEIETLLMSCRALGRGVEDAFLHGIAASAVEQGATTLVAPYRSGPRNGLIRDFLVRSGFEEVERDVWTLSIVPLPPVPPHVRIRAATAKLPAT